MINKCKQHTTLEQYVAGLTRHHPPPSPLISEQISFLTVLVTLNKM